MALGVVNLRNTEHTVKLQNIELQDRSAKLKQLELKFNQLNQNLDTELNRKTQDQQKIQQLESEKNQLEQQKAKLESDLQAKATAKQAAQVAATKVQNAIAPVAYASGGDAKSFIYMHESGNRPNAINASSGACGLGQALPCSKMGCSLSDYACQDAWFTSYMQARYGTWENAMAFWIAHKWW